MKNLITKSKTLHFIQSDGITKQGKVMNNNYHYRTFHLLLTIIFLTAYCLQLNATVRFVSKTGSSTPPYITWETAADSIQKCINICVFGDTIYVANGVYEEQVVMIPGLSLIGAGMDSCVVDSRSFPLTNNRTILMKDSCLVTGFYIRTSNNFDYGNGIRAEGQGGLVSLNKLSNSNSGIYVYNSNTTIYKNYCFNLRIGISIANSNSLVNKNDIFTLSEQIGSGISITAFSNNYKPTIDSNYIVTRTKGIDKSFGGRPIITNNEIITNGIGVQLSTSDSAIVNNNSIIVPGGIEAAYGINNISTQYLQLYNNQISGDYYYGVLYISPYNKIKNNLVSNAEGEIEAWGIQNLQYQFNNVWNSNVSYSGFTVDTTNISVDPMVINDDTTQGDLDFHLQMFSPLIDAGDPTILDKDSSRSDMGLYGGPYGESYVYVDLPPRSPVNLTVVVDTLIKLKWNRNTEADFNHYNLYRDTTNNFQIDSTKLVLSLTDTFYNHIIPTDVESLYFKLTAIDNQGNESNPSEEVGVLITSVKDDWKPLNNYILYQNFPNPFSTSTTIGYELPEASFISLSIYNSMGQKLEDYINTEQMPGSYSKEIQLGNYGSGIYYYILEARVLNSARVYQLTKRMVLLK